MILATLIVKVAFRCVDMKTLKPIIKSNLDVLFVGMNPHPRSVEKGGYFTSNGSFWVQLQKAGFTKDRIDDKKILSFNMGIMNLVDKPTKTAEEVEFSEWVKGYIRFKKYVAKYKPQNIVFIGKLPFEKVYKCKAPEYGFIDTEENFKVFVMIFPTFRGNSKNKVKILKKIKRDIHGCT